MKSKSLFLLIIVIGFLFRFYGFFDPWKRIGHYNYGGIHTAKMVECMSKLPLSESKAIPIIECQSPPYKVYSNHPPTILLALEFWNKFFPDSDFPKNSKEAWVYKLFAIFWAALNFILFYLIMRNFEFLTESDRMMALFVQSYALFGLYFDSHVDFMSQFSLFPILLSSYLILRNKSALGTFMGFLGSFFAWPNFFHFFGIIIYNKLKKRPLIYIVLTSAFSLFLLLALMMWLKQSHKVLDFVSNKIIEPGYNGTKGEGVLFLFKWVYQMVSNHSKHYSPFLASIIVFELILQIKEKTLFQLNRLDSFVLLSSAGIIYFLLAPKTFYVHNFLWLYLIPSLNILAALGIRRYFIQPESYFGNRNLFYWISLIFLLCYPYGQIVSNSYHEAINSFLYIVISFYSVYFISRKYPINKNHWIALVLFSGFVNLSQIVNYRNEESIDYHFCKKWKEEIQNSSGGSSVHFSHQFLSESFTRAYYCRDFVDH